MNLVMHGNALNLGLLLGLGELYAGLVYPLRPSPTHAVRTDSYSA